MKNSGNNRKAVELLMGIALTFMVCLLITEDVQGKEQRPRVNVNTATVAQLELLPGVGPKLALAIVTHRQAAPFKRANDLLKVKGIGPKTLAKVRPYVALSGPTTAKTTIRLPKTTAKR